jgi:hypothetical protein
MQKSLTTAQTAALAEDLEKMLDLIKSGELNATVAMRHRLEGAVAVLDVVQGRTPRTGLTMD